MEWSSLEYLQQEGGFIKNTGLMFKEAVASLKLFAFHL